MKSVAFHAQAAVNRAASEPHCFISMNRLIGDMVAAETASGITTTDAGAPALQVPAQAAANAVRNAAYSAASPAPTGLAIARDSLEKLGDSVLAQGISSDGAAQLAHLAGGAAGTVVAAAAQAVQVAAGVK